MQNGLITAFFKPVDRQQSPDSQPPSPSEQILPPDDDEPVILSVDSEESFCVVCEDVDTVDPTCEGVTSIVHVQQRDPTEEMWTLTSSYMQRESPVPVCNPTGSVRDLCTWQEKDSSSIQQLPVSAVFILIIELTKAMYRRKINLVKAYYKGMCPTRRWFIYQIFWYDYTHYLLYTCLIIFPLIQEKESPRLPQYLLSHYQQRTPCDLSLSIRVTKKRRKIAVAKTASLQHSGSNLNHGLWVDMYRPLTCEQVCGNSVGAEELRGWLCSHQGKRNKFEEEPTNALLLLGPPGCGKTAAVYAVAAQLGINVSTPLH